MSERLSPDPPAPDPASEGAAPADPAAAESPTTADSSSLRGRMGSVAAASAAALVIGQVVSLAQTVALARLLTPREVGLFAAGSVTTSFVSHVVEGGLRSGLIHREDRLDDAAETVFRATLVTGGVMSLLTLLSAPLISVLFSSTTAGVVAASMSGGILLFSLTNVPEALLQRQFNVWRRLVVGPAVALTFAIVSVALAAAGLGVWSMVIGSYASTAVWVLALWVICDWRPGRGTADRQMYAEMVRYGAPLAISSFADQSVKAVQAVVTGRFLSVSSLGLFRYGERIAQLPVGILVDIGANSLFPAYARIAAEPERFRRAYLQALGLLVVAAGAMAGVLVALGQPLVLVVLGDQWRGAGTVLVAMAGLGVGTALATSAEAIKGAGRTTLLNWVTGVEVVLGIGLVVVMTHAFGLLGVGLSVSLTSLAAGLLLVALARPIVGLRWRDVLQVVVPTLVAAAIAAAATRLLEVEVLRSPERSVPVALVFLVLGGLAFLAVFAVALRLLAPTIFAQVVQVVGAVLRSATGPLARRRAQRADQRRDPEGRSRS